MALQKSLDLNNGYAGDYWKIVKLDLDIVHDLISIEIELFKDHQTRLDNKSSIFVRTFKSSISSLLDLQASTVDNPMTLAYDYLKTLGYFSDSSDV